MKFLRLTAGPYTFVARLEETIAPRTCAAFERQLPFRRPMIQARWSGQAGFIPLGSFDLGVGLENATSYPAPGEILYHPPGVSEAEILLPYGPTRFASKVGQLAGNHFLTIVEGQEQLAKMGEHILWRGAVDVEFTEMLPR
ncbi:MAG: DUF3830 family protein [Bacillota bacterium]|nr:DUF3830 family protein [Bacillota bacterium]